MADQTITCPNPLCHKPFKLEVPAAQPMPSLVISTGLAEAAKQEPAQPAKEPSDVEARVAPFNSFVASFRNSWPGAITVATPSSLKK